MKPDSTKVSTEGSNATINLRAQPAQRQLIDKAASIMGMGKSRSI